jgi:hypothetical protein
MTQAERESFIWDNRVGYILVGPRELAFGDLRWEDEAALVFEAQGVKVYQVNGR